MKSHRRSDEVKIDPVDDALPEGYFGPLDLVGDYGSLRKRVESRALDLLKHWYPKGKLEGNNFFIGDAQGSPGRSLRFNIVSCRGRGTAFKGGNRFDIFNLNTHRRNWNPLEAAEDIEETLKRIDAGTLRSS